MNMINMGYGMLMGIGVGVFLSLSLEKVIITNEPIKPNLEILIIDGVADTIYIYRE